MTVPWMALLEVAASFRLPSVRHCDYVGRDSSHDSASGLETDCGDVEYYGILPRCDSQVRCGQELTQALQIVKLKLSTRT